MEETSQKQIEANQENAQKSTGPKSEEGKAVSRYNALKHGILSKEVLHKGEDEASLIELKQNITNGLKPVGELEILLTDRIIANIWRLRRLLEVEKSVMEWRKENSLGHYVIGGGVREWVPYEKGFFEERGAMRDMITNVDIERVLRYETAIERGIYKALHELQRLQAMRLGEKVAAPIAVDLDVSQN